MACKENSSFIQMPIYPNVPATEGNGMRKLNKMKGDGSALSTVLVILVVVIIIAAAAVAAFVFLNNNNKNDDKADSYVEGWILGPGTVLTYTENDYWGNEIVYEGKFVGQGHDYILSENKVRHSNGEVDTFYGMSSRTVPAEAIKSTETIETIDGIMELTVVETTFLSHGVTTIVKSYVDLKKGLSYLSEYTTTDLFATYYSTMKLTKYTPVWQDPLEIQYSDVLGMNYTYNSKKPIRITVAPGPDTYKILMPMKISCLADGPDGLFAIAFEGIRLEGETPNPYYYLCDSPMGLPMDAVLTSDQLVRISTIDGKKDLQIWTSPTFYAYEFYYDAESGVVYRIVYDWVPGYEPSQKMVFDLTKKYKKRKNHHQTFSFFYCLNKKAEQQSYMC
jgi:hypothetical protein